MIYHLPDQATMHRRLGGHGPLRQALHAKPCYAMLFDPLVTITRETMCLVTLMSIMNFPVVHGSFVVSNFTAASHVNTAKQVRLHKDLEAKRSRSPTNSVPCSLFLNLPVLQPLVEAGLRERAK